MLQEENGTQLRREKYDWKEDNSLPKGWKMKISESKTGKPYFLSPEGAQFASIRLVYQQLVREEANPKDILLVRQHLIKQEGWQANSLLPAKWLFKKCLKKGDQVLFLTSEGALCESFLSATQHMKAHPDFYNDSDLERLDQVKTEYGASLRCEAYTWTEDLSLPPGWKMRASETKTRKVYYLSEDGLQFASRRLVYQHLISSGFDSSHILKMRQQLLKLEGWVEDQRLPRNWLFKKNHSKGFGAVLFLTSEGALCNSFQSASEYIKLHLEIYDQSQLDYLVQLRVKTGNESKFERFTWKEHPSLPSGWKMRSLRAKDNAERFYFLDPFGQTVMGRRNVLLILIDEKYSEEEVEKFRDELVQEGWKKDKLLPQGWRVRKPGKWNSTRHDVQFLTKKGQIFHGGKMTLEYLKSSPGAYSKTCVQNLIQLLRQVSVQLRRDRDGWREDEGIPTGWKVRTSTGKGKTGRQYFLSPDGKQFASRCLALQHQIKDGAAQEEIASMRKSLVDNEGWSEHTLLPQGWLFKRNSYRGLGNVQLLSCEGAVFESFSTAAEFMKLRPISYSKEDVACLNQLKGVNSIESRQQNCNWVKGDNLPEGWTTKKTGQKVFFLSPLGEQLSGRRKMLRALAKENFPEDIVESFREELSKDGWKKEELLPKGWRMRTQGRGSNSIRRDLQFLTDDGFIFSGVKSSLEHMRALPEKYTRSCKNKFEQIPGAEYWKENYTWVKAENLPEGWKMKTTGKHVFFLAPTGKNHIKGRVETLVHLMNENFPEEVIDQFRDDFAHEDWVSDQLLPQKWLIRRRENGIEFLTAKGLHLVGFKAAREEASRVEEEKEMLDLFIEVETVRDVVSSHQWEEDPALPPGWRFRSAGESKFFLSPEGGQFGSRREALFHLVLEGEEEEATVMRSALPEEGWSRNDFLPRDWFFKRKTSNGVLFVTDAGVLLNSFAECKAHMVKPELNLSNEDLLSLSLFEGQIYHNALPAIRSLHNFKMKEESLKEKDTICLQGFSQNSKPNKKKEQGGNINKDVPDLTEKEKLQKPTKRRTFAWKEDGRLPEGWKWRSGRIEGGGRATRFFLDNDGTQFLSMQLAYIGLIKENGPRDSVAKMRKLMISEGGWNENEHLPMGWIFKESKNSSSSTQYNFITSEGAAIQHLKNAVGHLKAGRGYTDASYLKMETFLKERQQTRRKKENEKWEDDGSLPDGWKTKRIHMAKVIFSHPCQRVK